MSESEKTSFSAADKRDIMAAIILGGAVQEGYKNNRPADEWGAMVRQSYRVVDQMLEYGAKTSHETSNRPMFGVESEPKQEDENGGDEPSKSSAKNTAARNSNVDGEKTSESKAHAGARKTASTGTKTASHSRAKSPSEPRPTRNADDERDVDNDRAHSSHDEASHRAEESTRTDKNDGHGRSSYSRSGAADEVMDDDGEFEDDGGVQPIISSLKNETRESAEK